MHPIVPKNIVNTLSHAHTPTPIQAPVCIAIPYRTPSGGGSLAKDQLLCVLTKEVKVDDDRKCKSAGKRPQTPATPRSSTSSISSSRVIKGDQAEDCVIPVDGQDALEHRRGVPETEAGEEEEEEEWTETTALDITFNEFPVCDIYHLQRQQQ